MVALKSSCSLFLLGSHITEQSKHIQNAFHLQISTSHSILGLDLYHLRKGLIFDDPRFVKKQTWRGWVYNRSMQKQVPVTCSWCGAESRCTETVQRYRLCTAEVYITENWVLIIRKSSYYHYLLLLYDTRFLFAEKEQNRSKVTFKNTTSLLNIDWLYPFFHRII